jgi:hypothetical protein
MKAIYNKARQAEVTERLTGDWIGDSGFTHPPSRFTL